MKNITTLLAMAMLSTMSVHADTAACNDRKQGITAQSIAGIWMHNDRTDDDYNFIQFNADGTGLKWEVYKDAPNGQRHDVETFTFNINGNKIVFVEPDGDRDIEPIRMKKSGVLVIDHDTYTRQQN